MDMFCVFKRALSEAEIQEVMVGIPPGVASNPSPDDGQTDVPRDVVLSWTPGIYAPATNGHKVYLSENFNDVNDGIVADANSYAPPQRLDLSTTYYWRVDEVNGAPDYTVFEGKVWSFTTEPVGYSIENVTATASSAQSADTSPENTVNGSGLDDSGLLHHDDPGMWLSNAAGPQPTWIEFQFDKVYKLHEMWVWNSNGVSEPVIGFGFKDVSIEYSVNGTDYTLLGTTYEFARAPGMDDYAHNTTVDLSGVIAKHVRLTANSNWGGILNQYGLSEFRFFYIPVRARQPSPDSGATDVDVDVTLGFRAGREAAKHDVYLSSDEQAVIDSTAPVATVTETSYGPLSLDLGKTYYWKINEVNVPETPTTWESDLWSLATTEYLVVDDFESYNDLDPDDPESNRIFLTWIDGFEQPTNGSVVGYAAAPFAEQSIVHSGVQSMPLFYDNTGTARYSEAELTLSSPQDWSKHAVKALSLWFAGDPNNTTAQMYVKINGSKVAYDGDASNLTLAAWQPWNFELTSFGADLQNVTKLSIGIDGNGAAGTVYVDDIRPYPYDRQLTTPTEPDPANLVGHRQLDGNFDDSSGNGRHGIAMGNPTFVAGKIGQAISLDGMGDYVNITDYKGVLVDADNVQQPFTIACWFKTTGDGEMVTWGESNPAGHRMTFRVSEGRLRTEHGGGNIQGNITCNDGQWHHAVVTIARGAAVSTPGAGLWLDGVFDLRASTDGDPDPYTLTAGADVSIGRRADNDSRYFIGAIDDVRIYDRALTPEEIAWLVGKTKPFDEPF